MMTKEDIKKHKERTMNAVTAIKFLKDNRISVEWHESWSFCRSYLYKMTVEERIKATKLYYDAADLISGTVTKTYFAGDECEIILNIPDSYIVKKK